MIPTVCFSITFNKKRFMVGENLIRSVREGWDSRDSRDTAHHRRQDLGSGPAAAAATRECPPCPARSWWIPAPHPGVQVDGRGVQRDVKPPMCCPQPLPVSSPALQPQERRFGGVGPSIPEALPSRGHRDALRADGIQLPAAAPSSVAGARGHREGPGGSLCPAQTPASPGTDRAAKRNGQIMG